MEFARKHMHLNLMQWKNVIWSYESISTVSVYNNDYVYRRGFIGREALIGALFLSSTYPNSDAPIPEVWIKPGRILLRGAARRFRNT